MDYPFEDEEYEMAYGDELELMNEMEEDYDEPPCVLPPKVKRCLDFTAPSELPKSQLTECNNEPEKKKELNEVNGNELYDYCEKKRKAEQLFGDISDINDDDFIEVSAKRTKQCSQVTETDMQIMEKIIAGRKETFNRMKSSNSLVKSLQDEMNEGPSISVRVPRWAFVTAKTSNSEKFYIKLLSEEHCEQQAVDINCKGRETGLLSASFRSIWQQAEFYIEQKLDRETVDSIEQKTRAIEESCSESESGKEDESAELWVEKYKPRTYLELLSDESTNRTLLHWLKLWDKIVFNREMKVRVRQHDERKQIKNNFSENKFKKKDSMDNKGEELDENGCPRFKIALLCGPPGLGKTTLAHMVARHAGYKVVEMNASDDRSPELFRTQLEAATQMKSVLGQEPRPNCLVLDEIDGAPAPSIEFLVKFATGKDVGKKRGKKGATPSFLKRPIICICNDVYVPALRPLRQIAFIIHFPQTSSARLAQRLLEIARRQNIKTNIGALTALAEKTRNDVRSCVSVLHFFKAQGKELKLSDIQNSNIGQKDLQKGLFTVWQEIFHIQRPKRSFVAPTRTDGKLEPMPELTSPEFKFGDSSKVARMQSVLQTVQSYGDYERLAQGVFENYLNMNLKESYHQLKDIQLAMEWFCLLDTFTTQIHTAQNYVLMPYLPYAFVVWHFLFASNRWPKITYPSAGYETSVKETRVRQLVEQMLQGMTPSIRSRTSSRTLVMDTLPYLLRIIVPKLRPVSTQLYSKKEKENLQTIVNIMIDYNLNYIQERNQIGAYDYNLDPNMAEVVYFSDNKSTQVVSYTSKQLVSREVELEKMRRAEAKAAEVVQTRKAANPTTEAPVAVGNHLQSLKPKAIREECTVVKDFFGRIVKQSEVSKMKEKAGDVLKGGVWFHFKEGFSNAVRKPVKMSELF